MIYLWYIINNCFFEAPLKTKHGEGPIHQIPPNGIIPFHGISMYGKNIMFEIYIEAKSTQYNQVELLQLLHSAIYIVMLILCTLRFEPFISDIAID